MNLSLMNLSRKSVISLASQSATSPYWATTAGGHEFRI